MDLDRIIEIHVDMCINEVVTKKLKERLSESHIRSLNVHYAKLSPIWFWNYDGHTYATRSSFVKDFSPFGAIAPQQEAFWKRLRKAIRRAVK